MTEVSDKTPLTDEAAAFVSAYSMQSDMLGKAAGLIDELLAKVDHAEEVGRLHLEAWSKAEGAEIAALQRLTAAEQSNAELKATVERLQKKCADLEETLSDIEQAGLDRKWS